jgi:hypothetical protein
MISSRILQVNRSKWSDQEKIESALFRVYPLYDSVFKNALTSFRERNSGAWHRAAGDTRVETAVESAGKVEYK